METRLSSRSREVVIAIDRPFVIIGERINPTGRKVLAAEMKDGVMDRVRADARAQADAGAHMLDVNAGIPAVDEPALLVAAIKAVIGRRRADLHRLLDHRGPGGRALRL